MTYETQKRTHSNSNLFNGGFFLICCIDLLGKKYPLTFRKYEYFYYLAVQQKTTTMGLSKQLFMDNNLPNNWNEDEQHFGFACRITTSIEQVRKRRELEQQQRIKQLEEDRRLEAWGRKQDAIFGTDNKKYFK